MQQVLQRVNEVLSAGIGMGLGYIDNITVAGPGEVVAG